MKKLWQEYLGELSTVILLDSMQTQQSSLRHKGRWCYDSQTLGRKKIELFLTVQKHVPRATCTCCLHSEGLLGMCILLLGLLVLSLIYFQGVIPILSGLSTGSCSQERWHHLDVLGWWKFFNPDWEEVSYSWNFWCWWELEWKEICATFWVLSLTKQGHYRGDWV